MTCNFIESLVEGTYDEYGEIVLSGEKFELKKWKNINEYKKIGSTVSGGQVFGLIFSIGLVSTLAVYSLYLHRKVMLRSYHLNRGKFNSGASVKAGKMSRVASGIGMMRSGSAGSVASSITRSTAYQPPSQG